MPSPVHLLVGLPASGKSSIAASLSTPGTRVLSRDKEGGSLQDLLGQFKVELGRDVPVVLDNTSCTVEERAPFVAAARAAGRSVTCHWMTTSAEDAQVNALHRMWDRYDQVFFTAAEIKAHPQASQDPNMFPAAALFAYKKRFEKPTTAEGFDRVVKIDFVRRPGAGTRKALVLDYDGTLRRDARELAGAYPYPTRPSEVQVLPGRAEVLRRYQADGYLLLGASNQSGIAKGHLTSDDALACFRETSRQLGVQVSHAYCPHSVPPVSCYCRKPQAGIGVYLTRLYGLDPAQTLMVGDLTTDRTFAARCGFSYEDASVFFR